MALILLRHLEGVGPLEWAVEQADAWTEELEDYGHNLAVHHFGICEEDIELDDSHFPQLKHMRDESDAYWASHGWDITDGEGQQLAVMDLFLRPMVCMVERLHPDAHYAGAAKSWGEQMAEEAARFKRSR